MRSLRRKLWFARGQTALRGVRFHACGKSGAPAQMVQPAPPVAAPAAVGIIVPHGQVVPVAAGQQQLAVMQFV